MVVKLDLKDKKILYELDRNSRQPASKIAKNVGLSTDGTNYRIKRLVKNEAIFRFITLLNTAKLGLTTYKLFYRFQNTTPENESEIIQYMVNHPNTQLVTETQGVFDLNVNFIVPNIESLHKIITEVRLKYGEFLADKEVTIMVQSHFFYRSYLLNKKLTNTREKVYYGSDAKVVPLDRQNKQILTLLAKDARVSAVDIAREIGLSSDAVIHRIKKLEHEKIIQDYLLFLNPEKIGYTWYYVMVKFRDLTGDKENKFFQFCNIQPNIWNYTSTIGPWECVFNVDVESDEHLKQILTEIKKDFSQVLREYSIIKIIKTHKFNQYPMGADKS